MKCFKCKEIKPINDLNFVREINDVLCNSCYEQRINQGLPTTIEFTEGVCIGCGHTGTVFNKTMLCYGCTYER